METELYFGRRLTEAGSDKRRIYLQTGIRVFPIGALFLANPVWEWEKPVNVPGAVLGGLIILAMVVWALWPLIHCRDYLIFYERGIDICGKKRTLEELGEISFLNSKSSYSLFTNTFMRTSAGGFDITYIKDAKRCFNQAYYHTVPLARKDEA